MAGLVDSAFPGTPLPSGASTSRDEGAVLAELMPAPLWGTVHQYALLRGHHKLLVTPGGERLLYDVQDDPSERHNLAAERADMVTQLATVLTQSATTVSPPTPAGSPATPDPALRERLRALGYDF
jgi:hypothetical protein